jgi:ABC-type multidrug transport system ATPase subunit
MTAPRLLLLDEPSLGLAPALVTEIFRILVRINGEEGVSILLVEQNATAALDVVHHAYLLENGRVVMEGASDVLKNNPDLVRKVVRATIRGWEYAQQHPEEAVGAGLKRSEGGKQDVFMRQLTETFKLLHTRNSEGKPLGWMSEADWEDSLKLLRQYFGLEGNRPAKDFYTNDFLPT